jgi:hypothetical protein
MAILLNVCKKLSAIFFAISILFASSVAEGADSKSIAQADATVSQISADAITSSVLMRADADIQIRRIKTFMASKKADADKEIEQLEKLQKILHGQN